MNNQKKGFVARFKSMIGASRENNHIMDAEARADHVMQNQRRDLQGELTRLGQTGSVRQGLALQSRIQKGNAMADTVMQRRKQDIQDELTQMHEAGAARKGVARDEKGLARYLTGRGLTNRTVEGDQLTALRSGNQTVNETRAKLSKGRGNVDIDVERSGHEHESSRRTKIGRDLAKDLVKDSMSVARKGQVKSSIAELCRAGNCGEHAMVATHTHAEKLTGDQTVHKVAHKTMDHAWSELRMHPGGTSSDVILDAWAKGPAILREDSAFAHSVSKVKSGYSYDRTSGPVAARQVQDDTALLKGSKAMRQRVSSHLEALDLQGFKYSDKSIWAPTPVTSDGFEARVKAARKKQGGLAHEIVATGVARNLGANVTQARDFADSVVKRKK